MVDTATPSVDTPANPKADQSAKDKAQAQAILAACLAIVTLFGSTANELAFLICSTVAGDLRRVVSRKMDKNTKKRFDLLLAGVIKMMRGANYKARVTEGITSVLDTLRKIQAIIASESKEVRKQEIRDWLAYHLGVMPKKDQPTFRQNLIDGKVRAPLDKFTVDALGWAVIREVAGGPENSLVPRAVDDKVQRIIDDCTPDWIADQLVVVDTIAKHIETIGKRNIPVGPTEDGVSVATSYEYIQLALNLRPNRKQWAASLSYAVSQKLKLTA